MSETTNANDLYQEMILDHNRKPRNFRKMESATHQAEGFNPVCGDHFTVYFRVDGNQTIQECAFEGSGCAISKASASMMTQSLVGKSLTEARTLFDQFHGLLLGQLNPEKDPHALGKLKIFSGIWKFPSRVKCAGLSWHAAKAAWDGQTKATTE